MNGDIENKRRKILLQALGLGLLTGGSSVGLLQPAYSLGGTSRKLPPGRSIYKLKGSVTVNGIQADINTQIEANALIKTGPSSRIIFAVGADAFILRSNSELQLGGDGILIRGLRILSGKLLSVFEKRIKPFNIQTLTATIGIRGTGVYIESDPEQSYICTCYGLSIITSNNNPNEQVEVTSKHHDEPFYILSSSAGKLIRPAPVINHSDQELELIEQLVGRNTPFTAFPDYGGDGGGGGGY